RHRHRNNSGIRLATGETGSSVIHATEVQRDSLSEIVDDQAEKIEALQARIAQLTLELDRLQPAKAMKPRKERG
ncbi:MAG: hypothetical protein WA746_26430, partial [Isosphaeraceae bacterium]